MQLLISPYVHLVPEASCLSLSGAEGEICGARPGLLSAKWQPGGRAAITSPGKLDVKRWLDHLRGAIRAKLLVSSYALSSRGGR